MDVRTHALRPETHSLRAYAHQVPRYYIQDFGSAVAHPDTNEYAAFVQDTVRLTNRLALSMGARYDLQTFATKDLVSNPLWPMSGKIPVKDRNVSPRIGLAYSIGHDRPLVVRAGIRALLHAHPADLHLDRGQR